MASNAKFEIEIYGNTAKFENSLRGINTAMSGLKGEASALKKALQLDPTNTDKMRQLQKNLQQQLSISKDRAAQLKKELADVDKSTPEGQKKWVKLSRDLANTSIQADKLEADIKEVDAAIKNGKWETKAKVDLDDSGVSSKIEGFKSKFNGLREIAVGAFRQIGSSAVSALGNGLRGWVSDAMATQKAMISLKNTMNFKGNVKDFESLSKRMSKLATDTNANTEDTLKLATTFVGLGDSAEVAGNKTDALVKANQAFGGTGENLKGVVQAYGQMSAAGKVTAENINQLTDNNTALGAALKSTVMEMNPALKQYDSFAAASEDGAISVEMLDKAMQKLGNAGGGAVTTIGDAWDSFNETLSTALLPTLDALTPVITALIDKMAGWGESAGNAVASIVQYVQLLWYELKDNGALDLFAGGFKALGQVLGNIINIIKNVLVSFGLIPKKAVTADSSMKAISETLLQLGGKFEALMIKLANFTKKISESEAAMHLIKGAIVTLGAAFAAFKVAKGILAVINAFKIMKNAVMAVIPAIKGLFTLIMANPFVAIAVAIAAVVAGLVYFFTQTKKGKEVWANFVKFLQDSVENIKSFFSGLGTWFSNLWKGIVDGVKGVGQNIANSWNESVESIKAMWNGIVSFFSGIVKGIKDVWNGITEFFSNLWDTIFTTIQTVWNNVKNIVTGVVQWFMTTFQPLIAFYQSIFNLILSIINLAFQTILAVIRGTVEGIKALWNGIVGVVQTAWNGILAVVQNVMSAVGNFVQGVGNRINQIWQNILNFFRPIFQSIGNFANQIFNNVANFAQSAYNRIVGVWSVVAGFFSGIFNSVSNIVSNVFNAIGNFASNAVNRIRGVFSSIGSFFSGVFNSARNAVANAFNAFGSFAGNAVRSITGAFSGLVSFFSNIFGAIGRLADNVFGGITRTINGITSAVNGVAGKISGLFKSNSATALPDVNLQARGQMIAQSATAGSSTTNSNVFNINATGLNEVALARNIKRMIDNGRA
jgi:tape measure domain-containing protein